MNAFDNAIRRQVMSLPELIVSQYENLEPKTRTVLSFQEIFNIQRIILTGCGDSYAACMAQRYAFEMFAGVPTQTVPALELARYYDEKQLGVDCRNPLVIAISNSGNVSRVAEAVARVRLHGGCVLGITGNPDSLLAKNSDWILHLEIPLFESAPGTRSYMVSVMALLLLAIRFGEVRLRYTMDEAMAMRMDIRDQGAALERCLPKLDQSCTELAQKWARFPCYEFVGGGFDYASAWFGHAKILEAVGRFASAVNVEDWFHLNYFLRDADRIGTVLVANTSNPAASRLEEFLGYVKEVGRPLAVVTDGELQDQKIALQGGGVLLIPEKTTVLQVPASHYPMTMPLTQFVPLCLLAGVLAELAGEEYGRGSRGRFAGSRDGAGVNQSAIEVR